MWGGGVFLPLLSTEMRQSCSFIQTHSNMKGQKHVRFLKFKLYGFMPAEDWPIYLHFNSHPLEKKKTNKQTQTTKTKHKTQFKGIRSHTGYIMQSFCKKYSSKFFYLQSVKRLPNNKPTRCLGKEIICP